MSRLLFLGLLAVLSAQAFAADLVITWQHPTKNTDGSAITTTGPLALKETRLEWGTCTAENTFNVKAGEMIVPFPATTGTILAQDINQKRCVRGFSRNNGNSESTASNVVAKWIPVPAPMPPVLSTTVNVAWREYSDGRFVLAGYVPLGTACDASRSIDKYSAAFNPIPMESVQLFTTGAAPKTGTYVTICG